jgi:CspA family cold shock protein
MHYAIDSMIKCVCKSLKKSTIVLKFRIFYFSLFINNNKMPKGTVKFFNNSKGFGFIKPSDGGEDVFVHVSALAEEIRENDQVSYEVEQGKKGKNAVKVKVID